MMKHVSDRTPDRMPRDVAGLLIAIAVAVLIGLSFIIVLTV
jgi:hypothetical protein